MTRTAGLAACMLFVAIAATFAQSSADDQIELDRGRAALAKDPAAAIAHFERVDSRTGRAWLAVALMMESRSASDQYVERAFDAAGRARANGRVLPRTDVTTALQPGDLVVAFFLGEENAYAWAFDKAGFVGYQLAPPAQIADAANQAHDYIDANDRDGLQRVADDLMPMLFGPALDRVSQSKRVILVPDGPLLRLSIGRLPLGERHIPLQQQVEIVTAEYGSLFDVVAHDRTGPLEPEPGEESHLMPIVGIASATLLVAGIAWFSRQARRRSRARS